MTYSLHTLNNTREKPPEMTGWQRFIQEIALAVGFVVLLFWLLAIVSHSALDPAWTTSGSNPHIRNWGGRIGAAVSDLSFFLLGYSVFWCYLAGLVSWLSALANRLRSEEQVVADPHIWRLTRWAFWSGLVMLLLSSTGLEFTRLYRFESLLPGHHAGGVLGYLVGSTANSWLGFNGSGLIFIVFMVIGLSWVFRFSWIQLAEKMGSAIDGLIEQQREKREIAQDLALGEAAARAREKDMVWERDENADIPAHPVRIVVEPEPAPPKSERVARERQKPLFNDLPDSRLPQVELLDASQLKLDPVDAETIEFTSRLIEKKLRDFGVEVKVLAAAPGPVVTRYEIEPATGVKGSQVVNLAKDLARSLSMVSIRVVETIPGKNFMALELPNSKRQTIRLSEILGSSVYNEAKSMLTMGLGKDIGGNPVVADLAKMPHVLVAGTTGSGKSVGINAMILSLLYKAEARDVRMLMIDPKMLEMSVYEGIPHLLAPVVTDMRQAANGLNWCVGEMERRYKLMSKLGVRNLAGYNHKLDEARENGQALTNPFSLTPDEPEPLDRLPHIVVVITGLIKANIPTRIAFQVSSKIDSRTILDQMGAEALLGMGDMLYLPSGTGFPIRVHGAFVSDDEVHRVVSYLKTQGEPNYIEGVLEGGTVDGGPEGPDLFGDIAGEKDPLYDQAVEVVLKNRKASISLVQRHLKIGYNRAARLVEDMEKAGLVSAMSTNGQREILVPTRSE